MLLLFAPGAGLLQAQEPAVVEIRQVDGKYHLFKDGGTFLHSWSRSRIRECRGPSRAWSQLLSYLAYG